MLIAKKLIAETILWWFWN